MVTANNNLKDDPKDLVLIPAYMPDESLLSFVDDLLKLHISILVVDDGSGARGIPIFSQLPDSVTFLGYKENHGKGYAMKYAMAHILAHMDEVEYIVTADADGQHTPSDTVKVLDGIHKNPEAIVLGVRNFPKNTPLRSRIGNRLVRRLFAFLTKITDLEDTQTGLRAFHRNSLNFLLSVDGSRYEYEMRQLLDWAKAGRPILQVPIETIYRDKENSTSHYNTLKDSTRIIRSMFDNGQALLFAISGFVSFLLDFSLFNLFYYAIRPFHLPFALAIPNVAARLLSAVFNFHLNRNYVFESKDSLKKDALQYGGLVVLLLSVNSLLLSFYGNVLGIGATVAKLCVELTLFVASYLIQHFYIFANKRQKK